MRAADSLFSNLQGNHGIKELRFAQKLQQIPIKPATKEPTEKAQSRCHNDETN